VPWSGDSITDLLMGIIIEPRRMQFQPVISHVETSTALGIVDVLGQFNFGDQVHALGIAFSTNFNALSRWHLKRSSSHIKSHTPALFGETRLTHYNTFPCNIKTCATSSILQDTMEPTLNQQVPGSSPGRRTKVVKFCGLMHPNCRAHRATTRRFEHFQDYRQTRNPSLRILHRVGSRRWPDATDVQPCTGDFWSRRRRPSFNGSGARVLVSSPERLANSED
jgi:hypothetical protein